MDCKACSLTNTNYYPSHLFPSLLKFPSSSSSSSFKFTRYCNSTFKGRCYSSISTTTNNFTWDDVIQIGHSEFDPSDLSGFFDRVRDCNRNPDQLSEFVPFVVEEQVLGYVHYKLAAQLREFKDVFSFSQDSLRHNGHFDRHLSLNPTLKSPEDRTSAVANVIKCLDEEVIPGIRNELFPVISRFGSRTFFSLERAAAPYFGIKAYGCHMNGYVEKEGEKFLWVGKRSKAKPTFPGLLDHLVAGGLPHGIPCGANMIKECHEEAGIPLSISKNVKPVGAVSYTDIEGDKCIRHVLFCYDLKLPEDFIPVNNDGEMESFKLIPVSHVANVIKKTRYFKSNCNVVIIDFFFRHGYICPERDDYLPLLQSLRSGDCS